MAVHVRLQHVRLREGLRTSVTLERPFFLARVSLDHVQRQRHLVLVVLLADLTPECIRIRVKIHVLQQRVPLVVLLLAAHDIPSNFMIIPEVCSQQLERFLNNSTDITLHQEELVDLPISFSPFLSHFRLSLVLIRRLL